MGDIQFTGLGPYAIPNATGVSVQRGGDDVVLSIRFWRSRSAWTLLRIPIPLAAARALYQRLGAALGAAEVKIYD